ncbi:MAG: amidohydrolase family protein [Proteobacteria bacterium]|nr:amidohydrolase family protein [Pseudomonadota bacterium]MBU1686385.1 amidohydrolase family protein [Pseudomonadota bacterium]
MEPSKYIHAGHLIDGSGGPIQRHVLLTIKDGIITALNRFNPESCPDPARTTNFSHCSITPPLIDSHVHLAMSGTIDKTMRQRQLIADYDSVKPIIVRNVSDHFNHGILAVRDGGDRRGFVLKWSKSPTQKTLRPIQIQVAGRGWHQKNRYGSAFGRPLEGSDPTFQELAKETGPISQVKLFQSGANSLDEFGKETSPQFTLEELQNIVKIAAKRRLPVMVHANGVLPVQLAVKAGCRSIEHGYFMGRDNLQRMADHQIFWVPTIFAMKILTHNVIRIVGPKERDIAARNMDSQLKQLALARELGVPIALGTDAGSPGVVHGESLVEEMKLVMKAGYSLTEVIKFATSNGAQLLGLKNEGLIAKGKSANFLVVRGSPTQLPRKLAYLEAIYLNGTPNPLYRK